MNDPIDFTTGKTEDGRFFAQLNCRSVACTGDSEHEAIRGLMNYVAKLCASGCMDHTGDPKDAIDERRYVSVWGRPSPVAPPVSGA